MLLPTKKKKKFLSKVVELKVKIAVYRLSVKQPSLTQSSDIILHIKTSSEIINSFQVRSKIMVHYSSPKPHFDCQTPSSPTNKSKPNSFLRELWLNHLAFEPSSSSLNLKDMGMKKHRFCNIIGCINGNICFDGYLLDGFHGFVLWNPAIRKRKTVRYPLLPDCAACPSSPIIETL